MRIIKEEIVLFLNEIFKGRIIDSIYYFCFVLKLFFNIFWVIFMRWMILFSLFLFDLSIDLVM